MEKGLFNGTKQAVFDSKRFKICKKRAEGKFSPQLSFTFDCFNRMCAFSTSSFYVVLPVVGDFFVFSGVTLEDRADLKEVFHGICFEDQNELGHIGGCANETPAVFKLNACAVDIANLAGICSLEFFNDGANLAFKFLVIKRTVIKSRWQTESKVN